MRESARAALTYARAHARDWGYDPGFYRNTDIHIHVPEGAIPKDGPSAGITMATALISALSRRPVRRDVAMTGEITLRGHVLPIGGLNEKVMAAKRSGVGTVILPVDNARHLKELPRDITRGLEFIQASRMHEVLETALRPPAVRKKTASGSAVSRKGRKQSDPSQTGDGRRKRTPPAPPAPPGLGT
jgi:ATP-dependent Lon protease